MPEKLPLKLHATLRTFSISHNFALQRSFPLYNSISVLFTMCWILIQCTNLSLHELYGDIYVSLIAMLKVGFLMNYIFNSAQSQRDTRAHIRQPASQNLFNI